MSKIKIGFVGVGAISRIYLENLTGTFKEVEVIGVCDLIRERAERAVEKYNIPKLYNDMYELFADPEVDIVLNITRPYEHFDVTMEALKAGKHVYSEKPLAATLEEGRQIMALAAEKGLMVGGAPDTFMGAGIQTCRRLIEDGYIGEIIGANAQMLCHGHETWHPDPEFYYKHGGGPIFDMGPYYVTALLNLIGNVEAVYSMTKRGFNKRTITSTPHFGEIIDVDVDTHVVGTLRFENGAVATLVTSFDTYIGRNLIEIYGTKGTLYVPDPNCFGGPVKLYRPEDGEIREMPLAYRYRDDSRGLGLADMAKALQTGRKFRACSDMTFHALEVMEGLIVSGREKREVEINSRFEKKALMEVPSMPGILEA
ncbi:MAG: Gfo/Idh/MocA family oxidoreductase [Clostridia bacterium]|nr:Gfo/Idh/MocA family oxidoreductase [Clostridia bacterium]